MTYYDKDAGAIVKCMVGAATPRVHHAAAGAGRLRGVEPLTLTP